MNVTPNARPGMNARFLTADRNVELHLITKDGNLIRIAKPR
jgi:hypothetical protein